MKEVCNKCWWNDVCKRTQKACFKLQGVDLRWDESPNIKYRDEITLDFNLKAFKSLKGFKVETKANTKGDKQ